MAGLFSLRFFCKKFADDDVWPGIYLLNKYDRCSSNRLQSVICFKRVHRKYATPYSITWIRLEQYHKTIFTSHRQKKNQVIDEKMQVTYIIGHYNPSVRIIDLVSQSTYVVCFNFIHKWRDLQFKVDSERQISWETLHGNFIYSQSFCQKFAETKSSKKYFLDFVLMSVLGLEPWLYV